MCYQLKNVTFSPFRSLFVLYSFSIRSLFVFFVSPLSLVRFLLRHFLLLLSPSAMMHRVIAWSMTRHREL